MVTPPKTPSVPSSMAEPPSSSLPEGSTQRVIRDSRSQNMLPGPDLVPARINAPRQFGLDSSRPPRHPAPSITRAPARVVAPTQAGAVAPKASATRSSVPAGSNVSDAHTSAERIRSSSLGPQARHVGDEIEPRSPTSEPTGIRPNEIQSSPLRSPNAWRELLTVLPAMAELSRALALQNPDIELQPVPTDEAGTVSRTSVASGVESPLPDSSPPGRIALLEQLLGDKRRVDPQKQLDAVLLRRWAEDHYDKNEWNKLVPSVIERLRMRFGTFSRLVGSDFATVRAHLIDHPEEGSRHLLNQLARMKLLDAIGIDPHSFMDGAIRRSFLAAGFTWEQLHTNVGRVFASAFAGAAWGLEFVPEHHAALVDGVALEVMDRAAKLGKAAGQTLCSVLPTFVLTPTITGWARSNTDVFEGHALRHGFPALAPGLGKAKAMDARAVQAVREHARTCREAFRAIAWKEAYPEGVPSLHQLPSSHREAVEALIHATYQLYQVADTDYKLSMGSYKASAVGKAAGGVMNGLGTGVTLLSFLKRYDLAFYWSLGLIAAQPFSGMHDKNAMATYYVDAGLKWNWKSLVQAPYRNLPPGRLRPEHMDVSAGSGRWTDLEGVIVSGVKELYRYEVSKSLAEFDQTLRHLAELNKKRAASAAGSQPRIDSEIEQAEAMLQSQCEELEQWRTDIERFNSRDPEQWKQISPRLVVYLDDTKGPLSKLQRGQREARVGKPGEVLSQVMQRYKQLAQDLPLSFAVLYAAAKIMEVKGSPPLVCEAVLAIGAANYAANTWQTRSDKAADKPVLAKPLVPHAVQAADRMSARVLPAWRQEPPEDGAPRVDAEQAEQGILRERYAQAGRWEIDETEWTDERTPLLGAAGPSQAKKVPLVGEAGYRSARPGLRERGRQLLQVAESGVLSGPRALNRLVSTRHQRSLAHAELKSVEQAFSDAGFARSAESLPRLGTSMAATRAQLEQYHVVTAYLLEQTAEREALAPEAEASRHTAPEVHPEGQATRP
jgi:hypothetical protein